MDDRSTTVAPLQLTWHALSWGQKPYGASIVAPLSRNKIWSVLACISKNHSYHLSLTIMPDINREAGSLGHDDHHTHEQGASSESGRIRNLADPVMLDKIDKLFACNVGDYIDLPQLVVVGDQSSGKSSVLEGLTDLPFPRGSKLCTRFATQIVFRRSAEKRIAITIIPAKNSSKEYAEDMRAWTKIDLQSLNATSFRDLMDEVGI